LDALVNSLIEVRLGDWDVRDVENVADVLVDPESSLDKRNRCKKTCHSQLVGALQRSSKELW
jgi:type IV secretion system protein VirD4